MRDELLFHAQSLAHALRLDEVKQLRYSSADTGSAAYLRIQQQLREYVATTGFTGVFTAIVRDGQVIFGPESYPDGHPFASLPGMVYTQAPAGLAESFKSGRSYVEGPYADEFGTFVSAYAPVLDDDARTPVMMLGVDVEWEAWRNSLKESPALAFITALTPALLILAALLLIRHRDRSSRHSGRWLKHVEVVLVLVLGIFFSVQFAQAAHDREASIRKDVLNKLANGKAEQIRQRVQRIFDDVLDDFVRIHASSRDISGEEFAVYARPLLRMPYLHSLGWLEFNSKPEGESATAPFSIRYIEPETSRSRLRQRESWATDATWDELERMFKSGITGALYDPVEPANILLLRPLDEAAQGAEISRTCFFAEVDLEMILNLDELLWPFPKAFVGVTLRHVTPGTAQILPLYSSQNLAAISPLFVGDETFLMRFFPGDAFLASYPVKDGVTTLLAGLLLTLLLAALVRVMTSRRTALEAVVRARTEALNRSEANLRRAQEVARTGSWTVEVEERLVYWSPEAARITAQVDNEPRKLGEFLKNVHPEDRPSVEAAWGAALEGDASSVEFRLSIGGEFRWVRSSAEVERQPETGMPIYVIGTIQDIHNSRETELRLQAEQVRLHRQRDTLIYLSALEVQGHDLSAMIRRITETVAQTLDLARVSIWLLDQKNELIYCEDLFCSGEHSEGHVLRGQDYPAYFSALRSSEIISADNARTDRSTSEFTEDYLDPLGITSMLDAPIFLGGVAIGVVCHEHIGPAREWTTDEKTFAVAIANLVALALEGHERRRTEAQLRLEGAALAAAANAIVITNVAGVVEWVNPAFTEITGYATDEVLGTNPWELLNANDGEVLIHLETVRQGIPWHGEVASRRKDGSIYHEEQSITPFRNESGAITHLVAVHTDISERIAAEARLRDAREKLEQAVSAGGVGLWDWNLADGVIEYSKEWCEQAGCPRQERSGGLDFWLGKVNPPDQVPLQEALERCALSGEPVQQEFAFQTDTGAPRWILMKASAVFGSDGQAQRVVGANVDITRVKQLESDYRHAQKMESIGRLAGGVAHDFNNLLSVINGYCELITQEVPKNSPVAQDLQQIKRAADSAANLTRQLLAFSRRQVLRPVVFEVDMAIRESEKMLRRVIGEDIHYELDLGCSRSVLMDPGQLEQVLVNLAVNARDAMPEGGVLTIQTRADTRASNEQVLISVIDTGAGMEDSVRQHIFEPFFTTKPQGRGTGLGLATVFGIVEQSGGSIEVTSQVGVGSRFDIRLPGAVAATQEKEGGARPDKDAQGDETILLVEDEPALRALTERLLVRSGYKVLTASCAADALAMMEREGARIQLILSDVIMPGMSGPRMVEQLRPSYPQLRVLFMSGYTDDALENHRMLQPEVNLINKPFSHAQLTARIREILDGSAHEAD